MDSRKGAKIAEEESVGHGIIRAVKGLRPSAGRMLPVLHAPHGAVVLPSFLSWSSTMQGVKGRRRRGAAIFGGQNRDKCFGREAPLKRAEEV
jgi:hypothetical protein